MKKNDIDAKLAEALPCLCSKLGHDAPVHLRDCPAHFTPAVRALIEDVAREQREADSYWLWERNLLAEPRGLILMNAPLITEEKP